MKLIDATPIGINVRSTVATYANVHDELRKRFAKSEDAKKYGYKAGDFSYNTGRLRCPVCDGTGQISLDIQFLPDVDVPCPECNGSRYSKEAELVKFTDPNGKEVSTYKSSYWNPKEFQVAGEGLYGEQRNICLTEIHRKYPEYTIMTLENAKWVEWTGEDNKAEKTEECCAKRV